jgi:uncharacterized protein YggL (DUF469 family)
MIHEEICTYEVCKLAKEKGFNEPTDRYYHIYDDVIEAQNSLEMTGSGCADVYNSLNQYRCSAPTQSLLQRWLREEKNIDIAIVPLYTGGYSYIVYNIHCRDNRVVNTNAGYATYELALEDGLKYALENLLN